MPIVLLTRRATFSAAHRLHSLALSAADNLRVFGKCNNEHGHGHNYELEVTVKAPIEPSTGMVMNLSDLKQLLEDTIVRRFDHRHLNLDTEEFRELNPTAENLAVVCWALLAARLPAGLLHEVRVRETENNVVVYRGEG